MTGSPQASTISQGVLARLILGHAPLWQSFWLFFVLGGLFSVVAGMLLYLLAVAWSLHPVTASIFIPNVMHAVVFAWLLTGGVYTLASLSVWRCANNTNQKIFGYAARTIVAIHAAVFAWRFGLHVTSAFAMASS